MLTLRCYIDLYDATLMMIHGAISRLTKSMLQYDAYDNEYDGNVMQSLDALLEDAISTSMLWCLYDDQDQ